ncbi:MAG TPA: ATP-binding protein, partial [Longimicrobium sp.]|nr:ATP-binding protein [Longimicrobium sp.]
MRRDATLEPGTRAAVDSVLLRAATVGAFDPRTLLGGTGGPEQRRILVALAERCAEVRTEAGMQWMLSPDVRRAVLKAAGAERARAAARQTEPGDRFGTFLQQVLFDREVDAENLDTAALDELFTASQFMEQAGLVAGRRSPQVNRAIARREADAALRVVLPTPLVGRRRELATLRRFVKTGTVEGVERIAEAWPEGSPPILAVTGVGGTGKSALLATLMEELRGAAAGPMWPVVILDFDLPALASADPLEMLFTLTRQLGHARPELDDALSGFRVQCRRTLGLEESSSSGGYDSRAHQQSVALSELGPIIEKSDLASTPVVLVLDTFEEILVRGEVETRFVFKWLDAVRREGQFRELRVILAGRASSAEVVPELANRVLDTLVLGDLDEEDAFEMLYADLRRSGRSGAPVEKLVRTFGGNPLVLRILAQFARANDGDELYALVEGAHTSSTEKVTGELAQRFLYERILERIRDEEMKKLASLGLVLRRVTPELLREVLAGPCGFEHPESTNWDALFEKLRMQVWLVENEGERVRHRRDLRRLVLP